MLVLVVGLKLFDESLAVFFRGILQIFSETTARIMELFAYCLYCGNLGFDLRSGFRALLAIGA